MNARLFSTVGGLLAACVPGSFLFACDQVYATPIAEPPPTFLGGPIVDAALVSPRVPPVTCPQQVRANSPCTNVGAICEYGTSPDHDCNAIFTCIQESDGRLWVERQSGLGCPACPDPSTIVEGAPCTIPVDGGNADEAELHCTTATATCACTTGRDGAHAHPRKWVCTTVDELCPPTRPLFGQPCSGVRACDYGACESKRGSLMICEDDVWQTELARCE